MKKRMTILVCLTLVAALLAACGGKTPEETTVPATTAPAPQETTVPATTEATVPPVADHIISTPYVDLHFPGDWAPFLKTEIGADPFTITFYAVLDTREQPQRLFAISFGGKAEEAAAALKSNGEYMAVGIDYEEFRPDETWTERDINIVFTMQECLNHIMENLALEDADVLTVPEATKPASSGNQSTAGNKQESANKQETDNNQGSGSGQAEEQPAQTQPPVYDTEDMALDTPYMELHYPAMWAEYLNVQVSKGTPYRVGYYANFEGHGSLHLFTVSFGGSKGTLLKTIKTSDGQMVEIRIEVPELSLDSSWTEEEQTFAYAMQEDLNYLLDRMG